MEAEDDLAKIDLLPFSRTGAVAHAVVRRAKERSTLDDVALAFAHHRHCIRRILIAVAVMVDVVGQLLHIAEHVEETKRIRRITAGLPAPTNPSSPLSTTGKMPFQVLAFFGWS